MNYAIKRGATTVLTVRPEGKLSRKIMAEEIVDMSFRIPQFVKLQIGDRVEVFGNTYFMATEPTVQKVSKREFAYTVQFTGIKYKLAEVQLLFPDGDNALTVPDFSIMGTAAVVLDLIIQNANRLQSGWTKGTVDETETKLITFSGHNCLTAVAKVAEEFGLEFWIDGNKSIHYTERKNISGYTLEYGKAKGLRGLNRTPLSGSDIVTRLYATGSEKNLPKNYRNGQNRLRMDVPYLEKNVLNYGVIEHTEKFDDVYPKRVGTVTAVDAANPLKFTDNTLDFDLNEADSNGTKILIPRVPAKVIFQTGQLAGYVLEIREHGYNTATKTFLLNKNEDEKALEIPNALIRPAVGDTYILEDIHMPEAYKVAAEAELKVKAQAYLDANCLQRYMYGAIADPLQFRAMNINMQLGSTVNLVDPDFLTNEDIRVVTIVQSLSDPYDVQFELADVATLTAITREYFEQENDQVLVQQGIKYNAAQARRSYQFAREFHDNVFDGEGYFDMENIKPLSIETKMISLGSRLQQFGLPGIDFKLTNNTTLTYTAGKIVHQTINPDGLREWIIPANTVAGISTAFNNIYVKCQRVGTNASIIVTTQQIKVEQDPNFFHFEVGYLSSIIDNIRKIKTTYGFAQLNPAELSIGRISSPSGGNFIDLKPDGIDINGKVTFAAGSPAQTYVDNQVGAASQAAANAQTAANNAQTAANTANALLTDIASDNKVTAGEKTPLKMEWDSITAEVMKNGASAATYGISATAYNAAHTALLNYINSVSLFVNMSATTTVDGAALRNNFANYYTQRSALLTAISDKAKALADAAQTAANQAAANAAAAQTSANNANAAVGNLNTYIDGAFSDGMVSTAEAASIEKYINQLNADKVELDNRYTTIYADTFLAGTPKSNLLAAKNAYNTAHLNLINAINTAISDKKVTAAEKADVDAKFALYRNTLATLSTRFQEAAQEIERARVDAVQVGGRNLLLKTDFKKYGLIGWGLNGGNIANMGEGVLMDLSRPSDGIYYFPGGFEPGVEYTISIWTKAVYQEVTGARLGFEGQDLKGINIPTSPTKLIRTSVTVIPKNDNPPIVLYNNVAGKNGFFLVYMKLEKGNRATDWTPAPEDIDAQIVASQQQSATALAQAQNAQNTAAALQGKTSFLTTDIHGNVISTGTVAVGDAVGANAGITGVTDRGSKSVRFWAGTDFAGRNMAGWLIRNDGVEERWFNGVMIRQTGVINGNWQDLRFNMNGVLAKKEAIINGKILDEWYNNGVLAYQIGQNGIYYVTEIPESFTACLLLNLNSNTNTSDGNIFHVKIRQHMLQSESDPRRFILGGDTQSQYYSAGQNVYSESNKQYEGYKTGMSKFNNLPDGWYAMSELGMMMDYDAGGTKKVASLIRLQNGKAIDSLITAVETYRYHFITF